MNAIAVNFQLTQNQAKEYRLIVERPGSGLFTIIKEWDIKPCSDEVKEFILAAKSAISFAASTIRVVDVDIQLSTIDYKCGGYTDKTKTAL